MCPCHYKVEEEDLCVKKNKNKKLFVGVCMTHTAHLKNKKNKRGHVIVFEVLNPI